MCRFVKNMTFMPTKAEIIFFNQWKEKTMQTFNKMYLLIDISTWCVINSVL